MKKGKSNKKTTIIPLGDRVLIEEIKQKESKSEGGIYLPSGVTNDKGSKKGKVIAVGEGRIENGKRITPDVKKGDTVLYGWGDSIEIDGKEYDIVRENEINAIIR